MMFILFLMVCTGFLFIRNEVAYQNRVKILNAICDYNLNQISSETYGSLISYDEMEPYESTMWRIWDFGCIRIVPPETFKMIQPYLH